MAAPLLPYALVALVALLEGGEFSVIFTAYQFHAGDIALYAAIGVLFVSIFIGDLLWYYFGHNVYSLPFVRCVEPFLIQCDTHLKERPLLMLFAARFSYGFHHPILSRLRSCGISLPRMLVLSTGTLVLWVVVMGGIVVFIAEKVPHVLKGVHMVEYALATFFILLIAFELLIRKRLKSFLGMSSERATGQSK